MEKIYMLLNQFFQLFLHICSFEALKKTKECVIAVPTVDLSKKVVQIGSCSGADIDKFKSLS
jgi:flavin reductase (DIM6/NTAB) family NADH-FMN oxidoreductase RutF